MKKKVVSIILMLSMLIVMLSGCSKDGKTEGNDKKDSSDVTSTNDGAKDATEGGKTFNGIDISEPVELTMYLLGDRTPDFDMVYGEINKILKEKLNATINVQFISWSEHATKYSLLFSGGEEFDLIFTAASWGHYEETVAMGGFYPLTEEFIQTYAPGIYEVLPEMAWNQAKVEGNIYMVPNYQNEFGATVAAVRGDLMEKYGFSEITTFDQLMAFYDKIVENETNISPLGTQGYSLLWPWLVSQDVRKVAGTPAELFVFNTQDPEDLSITYSLDWDEFNDYCRASKERYEKGYWSPDSLATTEETQDGFLNGRAASFMWNKGTTKKYGDEANKANPGWKSTIVDVATSSPKAVNSYINNGVGINAASKNKERALMVLNEFYTNKEINNLSAYGIDGVHYEAVGEDQYKVLEGNANFGMDANCNWGWVNSNIRRTEYKETLTELDLLEKELQDKWTANIKPMHIYDGFSFNNEVVSSEIAAVSTVLEQYFTPVILGMAGDVDVALAELRKQLDAAGIQTIYEEIKKQAAEHVEKNK